MGYSKNRPFVKVDVTGEVDKRFDEVTSQLAEKAEQTDLVLKADKTLVYANYSALNTKINSQASGSPKGTYATLTALETAFPTGNTNIYVVTADGNWYYWNGSAWGSGGIYQATPIQDGQLLSAKYREGSVTPLKTSFIKRGKNLFDKTKSNIGYYLAGDGTAVANVSFNITDYIPVTPNTAYIKNGGSYVIDFYGPSKTFISKVTVTSFTTPSNCYFIRATIKPSEMDSMQIQQGSTTTSYESYKEYLQSDFIKDLVLGNISTEDGNLKTLLDNLRMSSSDFYGLSKSLYALTKSVNMFNKTTKTDDAYVSDNTGSLVTVVNWYTSDYIKIKENEKYTINVAWYIAYYDVKKNFIIGSNLNPQGQKTVTTPYNCVYVRFSYNVSTNVEAMHNTQRVNEGGTLLPFTPHQSNVEGTNVYDTINLPNKIYGIVGKEINIYFDNILSSDFKKYNFNVICSVGEQQNERWTCVPTTTGTYPMTLEMYKDNVLVQIMTTNVIVKSKTVGDGVNKKAILIGDSTTSSGMISYGLSVRFGSSDVMDLTLLGSRGTGSELHEGRSGWKTLNYTTQESIDGVLNAFWNPTTSAFDFSYYMSQQGYAGVDHVNINLGINDVFSYTDDTTLDAEIINILARYQTMVDSIHLYDVNIKIGLSVTVPPSYNQDSFGKNYGNGQTRFRYKRNNFRWLKAFIENFKGKETQNIYLVPINTNLDTQNNMVTEVVAVNSQNTETIERQVNGVHPAGSGYDQISDVFYYFIKSFEA